MGRTWTEKLDNGRKPKIVRIAKAFAGIPAGSNMVVSTPREVDSLLKKIPAGRFLTQNELRRKLAGRHGADAACPISTGIFLRIASEAAWEQMKAGKDSSAVTPFWRAVAPGSPLARKLSCGEAFVKRMQREEGITPA